MIARSYVWVRVISNTPHDVKSVHWLTDQFSGLSDLCTSFLPPRFTSITFEIGEANQPRPAITEVEVNRCSLIIPYQYDSFAQLCTTFREEWNQLLPVSITCPSFPQLLRKTVDVLIIPFLLSTFCPLPAPTESFDYRSLAQTSLVTSSGRDIIAFFEVVCFTMTETRRLQQAGYKEEADLYLLYNGKLLCQLANAYIQPPATWLGGSYDPGDPNWWMSEANIYRNAVISLLHHIECLACLIYADQYRRYGVNWVCAHYILLTEGGTRWLEEPRWQWFGLSNHEMAEIHHARGLILKVVAEVLHEFRTLWDAASLESAMRKEQEAAQEMYFAKQLHPENELYDRLFAEYAGRSAEFFGPEHQYRCWSFDYTDVTGQAQQWVGDWRMVISWGGTSVLPFLPLAQKNFDDIFDEDK
jgi:hypothetical protein